MLNTTGLYTRDLRKDTVIEEITGADDAPVSQARLYGSATRESDEVLQKARRIVDRRFRSAGSKPVAGTDRALLETMHGLALRNAEIMLRINPNAFANEGTDGLVLPLGSRLVPGRHTPESLLHGRLHIPSMPGVMERLGQYLKSGETSGEELERIIRHDIALTLSLLRLVNSPLYEVQRNGRRIGTVREAVMVAGGRQLASLAFAAAELGGGHGSLHGLSLRDFWHHSLMTACLARELAREAGLDEPESFFTAGLLHDAGRLLLVDRIGRDVVALYGEAARQGIPYHEAERKALGFDHGRVGAALLERWNLDRALVEAVQEHHSLMGEGLMCPVCAAVVAVADFMARALGYLYWNDAHVQPPAGSVWMQIGISMGTLETVARRAYEEYERASFVFDRKAEDSDKFAA